MSKPERLTESETHDVLAILLEWMPACRVRVNPEMRRSVQDHRVRVVRDGNDIIVEAIEDAGLSVYERFPAIGS